MSKQARSYSPGTQPVDRVYVDVPDCPPDGGQCTWGWSGAEGKHYLKYINSACLKHPRTPAIRNGLKVGKAA
jgi:hypothetical protein